MFASSGGFQRPLLQLSSLNNSITIFAEAQHMWAQFFDDIQALKGRGLLYDTQWLIGGRYQLRPEYDLAGKANTSIAQVWTEAAINGSDVLALAWRNYGHGYGGLKEEEGFIAAMQAANAIIRQRGGTNRAEAYVDARINELGSLHQKSIVVGIPNETMAAYLGGIDFCESRWDVFGSNTSYPVASSPARKAWQAKMHALKMREGGGEPMDKDPTPGWHDNEVRISGPGAFDVAANFANRWNEQSCYLTDIYPVRQGPLQPIPNPSLAEYTTGAHKGTVAMHLYIPLDNLRKSDESKTQGDT